MFFFFPFFLAPLKNKQTKRLNTALYPNSGKDFHAKGQTLQDTRDKTQSNCLNWAVKAVVARHACHFRHELAWAVCVPMQGLGPSFAEGRVLVCWRTQPRKTQVRLYSYKMGRSSRRHIFELRHRRSAVVTAIPLANFIKFVVIFEYL